MLFELFVKRGTILVRQYQLTSLLPKKTEKLDLWDSNNSTNFEHFAEIASSVIDLQADEVLKGF